MPRRVLHPGVLQLLGRVNQSHALTQRERITLGLLAATEGLSATELAARLGLSETGEPPAWTSARRSRGSSHTASARSSWRTWADIPTRRAARFTRA